MYWNSRSFLQRKNPRLFLPEESYRQIAPPKPSFVKEPDISDMMPEWLKERKKAEEEDLKAFRKQDNNTINEKISQSNTSSGNSAQTSVNRNTAGFCIKEYYG